MKEILHYFEKMDRTSISQSIRQSVLELLKDKQFNYKKPIYNNIVRGFDRLGLLKDLDILKIIAEHPYKKVFGFDSNAPHSIFRFWTLTLKKEYYKEKFKEVWEKHYIEDIQKEYFSTEVEKDFAFDLLTLSQVDFQLRKKYKEIILLESEIADLQSSIDVLKDEIKDLNQDTPVIYKTIREERASDKEAIVAVGSGLGASGGIIGFTVGACYGTLVAASSFGIGAAVAGFSTFALHSYYQKNWGSPVSLEYKDTNVPFIEAKTTYTCGQLKIIESKGDQGGTVAKLY